MKNYSCYKVELFNTLDLFYEYEWVGMDNNPYTIDNIIINVIVNNIDEAVAKAKILAPRDEFNILDMVQI